MLDRYVYVFFGARAGHNVRALLCDEGYHIAYPSCIIPLRNFDHGSYEDSRGP